MNDYEKYISDTFHPNNIECLSRLQRKNLVFKINKNSKDYVVKIYLNDNNRINTEIEMYNYFKKNEIINVPKFEQIDRNVLLLEYINGKSFKKIDDSEFIKKFGQIYHDLNKIWSINDIELPYEKIGVDIRNNTSIDNIFSNIKNYNLNINCNQLIEIYNYLYSNYSNTDINVINSDISAHEIIISDDKLYWIDFELFKYGDINNDLARSFYSLTNSRNEYIKKYVYEYIKNNKYYVEDNFLYFLIEKYLGNIYVTNGNVSEDELKYYEKFILDKCKKKTINFH